MGPGGARGLRDAHGGDDVLAPAGTAGALRGRERAAAVRLRLLCLFVPSPYPLPSKIE